MEKCVEIERSIIKKFRKDIWSKFIKAISDYELIKENDNIMVCISGGKDSFLLAKCIQELIKHGKFPFTAHYVVMDPGYNKVNRQLIEKNAKLLNVPIEIFETNIFDVTAKVEGNPCYLCARMRRGNLYSKAKAAGLEVGVYYYSMAKTVAEAEKEAKFLYENCLKGKQFELPIFLDVEHKNQLSIGKTNLTNVVNAWLKIMKEYN